MAKQPIARYVTPSPYESRVTLTAELPSRGFGSTVYFLGEFEGNAVAVEVYETPNILAIRRVLAEGGPAIFDTPTYRMDLATDEQRAAASTLAGEVPIQHSREERIALEALRLLVARGVIAPSEGAAS